MYHLVIESVNLFLAGILAGEEFVVRYGVRAPLAATDDTSHIQFRQALIRTLRVLVPAIFLPAFLSGIAVAITHATGTGFVFRWAGVLALLIWILVTSSVQSLSTNARSSGGPMRLQVTGKRSSTGGSG